MADAEITETARQDLPIYDSEKSASVSKDLEKTGQLSLNPSVENGISTIVLKHADPNDADEAMKALKGHEGEHVTITPEEEKRLVRKIDLNLMPILCVVYGLNYLDKTTLSYASIMGLQNSLHLHGSNYQWLGSIFYIGYLAWEYPTNLLLQRFPLAKWSSFNIIMWGLTLCCMASTKNFASAISVRFFLGVFEAAVTPGFALFTSQWYTQSEQATRIGIWFSFNGFAQILGGLLAYGIATGLEKHPAAISSWKVLFLVIGFATAVVGILFWWAMPDNQFNAWFLNEKEKRQAVERIRRNQQGVGNKHFKWYQFWEALRDPLTWAFVFYALTADIPNGGISNFFSQLIVSFGYTPSQSLLYGTPGGAIEVISLILCGYIGSKTHQRILVSLSGILLSILGMLLIICLPFNNNGGRLAGYYLTQASPTGFVALLGLVSSNVAGYIKKVIVAVLYLVGYCVGNVIVSSFFFSCQS